MCVKCDLGHPEACDDRPHVVVAHKCPACEAVIHPEDQIYIYASDSDGRQIEDQA